jgi:chromosome segregation ATPase
MMQEKLEARIEELKQKLSRLQARHSELTQELQAVANDFVKTQGALEEAYYQLKELAGKPGKEEARKGGER